MRRPVASRPTRGCIMGRISWPWMRLPRRVATVATAVSCSVATTVSCFVASAAPLAR